MTTFGSSQDGVATNVTTETKTIQTGRTRAYGLHYVGTATGGVIELKDGATSKVKIDHGAVAESKTVIFPTPILFKTNNGLFSGPSKRTSPSTAKPSTILNQEPQLFSILSPFISCKFAVTGCLKP